MNEMKKITVLETIPHDSGYICYNGIVHYYSGSGDVVFTIRTFIEMGAIPSEMVDFYTPEEAVLKLNEMG